MYPKGRAGFKRSHNATAKQDTIERHTGMRKFQSPFSREIWLGIVAATESTSGDQDDVGASPESRVHGQNRRVKVFK